jgi:aspartyl aminopeptidase
MDTTAYNTDFFSFLSASPTPFHAVDTMVASLKEHGFSQLTEDQPWQLIKGNGYFVTREQGALIAFILGKAEEPEQGFRILAAHTDSPCLQIKPRPEICTGGYQQLGVEVYGGSLLAPWFDRSLSLAGRVCCCDSQGKLHMLLVDFKRPLLTIPNVAIHLNRTSNSALEIDKQQHLPAIISQSINDQFTDFTEILKEQIGRQYSGKESLEILSFDMFCYDCEGPLLTGINNELISSPRLDNLLSCHAGLTALISAEKNHNALLFCANHEENGSLSSSGAQGSFISCVLERILPASEQRMIGLNRSFLISADNAHASHPNFMSKMDAQHHIQLNMGPVIKINANQRYTTSSLSSAIFKKLCTKAGISPQEFVMRSDLPCGSTIGPMTAARLGIKAIDVGAASLAMHSIRELTGASDPLMLCLCLKEFIRSELHRDIF